jgi:hypothetical protein
VCSPAGAPAGIFPPDGSCKGAAERGNHTADLAERYGWINRALHAAVDHFAKSLDHRIAGFRAAGRLAVKDPINAIALAEAEDFRRHSDLFSEGGPGPKSQSQIQAAMKHGFQTRNGEMALARMLGDWVDVPTTFFTGP